MILVRSQQGQGWLAAEAPRQPIFRFIPSRPESASLIWDREQDQTSATRLTSHQTLSLI